VKATISLLLISVTKTVAGVTLVKPTPLFNLLDPLKLIKNYVDRRSLSFKITKYGI
jgi:hypothetical protein